MYNNNSNNSKWMIKEIENYLQNIAKPKITIDKKTKFMVEIDQAVINSNNTKIPEFIFNEINDIHHKDQYPLSYLFFKKLYELGVLSKIFKFLPDLNDFWEFVEWHRTHQHLLDLNRINSLLESIDDSELENLYSVLFKVRGHREKLHQLLYENMFISLDIQHYAECTKMHLLKFNDDKHNFFIYIPYDSYNDNRDVIEDIIKITYIMRYLAHRFNSAYKNSNIHITILLSEQRKYISDKDQLCPNNINSGCSVKGEYVMVWRREEVRKVLIHELVHLYDFDIIMHPNYNAIEREIHKKFKISGIDYVNEAYTEIFALIIHTMYVSHRNQENVNIGLTYELLFSLLQCAKIIKFFDGDNYDSLQHIKFKQSTSVLSYYIIKTLLLININKTLDVIESDIYGNLSQKHIIDIVTLEQEPIIINTVNHLIDYLHNMNNFMKRTMRMTILELR